MGTRRTARSTRPATTVRLPSSATSVFSGAARLPPCLLIPALIGSLAMGGCFPVAHRQKVPPVSAGERPSSLEDPNGEVLVLVLWHNGTYRWSRSSERKAPFLSPPLIVEPRDLERLDDLAAGYRNYGVVAFDGHGGTVVQDKEPHALYLIAHDGKIEWLLAEPGDESDHRLTWRPHATAELGEGWRSRLRESLTECARLTRTAGACDVSDTPFADALLSGDSELVIRSGGRPAARAAAFLSRLETSETADWPTLDSWTLLGEE